MALNRISDDWVIEHGGDPRLDESGRRIFFNAVTAREEAKAMPQRLATMFKSEADPYSAERDQVIRDPSGALNNSPFFKFMQEKYLNNATAKNAAGGLRNSGRGLMALGEAGQKASADYLFPYLNALGRPQSGANVFMEWTKAMNTPVSGGGGRGGSMRTAAPRQSLASMGGAAPAAAAPSTGLPYSDSQWNGSMGYGGYQPSAGAGTGYVVSDAGTTQFTPGAYGQQLSTYEPWE